MGPFVPAEEGEQSDFHVGDDCFEPKAVTREGTFAGHYSVAFEESQWTPCESWPDLRETAFGVRGNRAWVEIGQDSVPWPHREPGWTRAVFYMRGRGRLTGPGSYGHMGVSPYLLVLDSILEVRLPSARDCSGEGG